MKIFAIRDESAEVQKDLAYLFYYETERKFYIELPSNADARETPLLLDTFVKRKEMTVDSYWSRIWVQQRIIPPDRQNISEILRDNNLPEYDEFGLLMLAMGKCAQDDYYLVPVESENLPDEIKNRFSTRVEDVFPLGNFNLLVFFRDGVVKKCDMLKHFKEVEVFRILLSKPDYFKYVEVQPGGYGVSWDINMSVPDFTLYRIGQKVPLKANDFRDFVANKVVDSLEAAEILHCSRQNISDLTAQGKLPSVKTCEKGTLYLKSEVLKQKWQ